MLHLLLRWLTDRALADSMVGDLDEQRRLRRARSPIRAWWWHAGAATALVAGIAARRMTQGLSRPLAEGLGARGLGQECLQGARALARTPASTTVIVTTLALGLGLTTAIYSVVYGVLFQPLPFPDADRVAFVESRQGDAAEPTLFGTSLLDYRDLQASTRAFSDMATTAYWTFTVTGTDRPMRLVGNRVSGTFFRTLGAPPMLGRWIEPADDGPGAPEVAVLSHGLWQRMFGGQASIVGREFSLNGQPTRIIGVMPAAFRFPFEDVELWVPMRDEMSTVPRASRFFVTLGRLAPGITVERAQQDLSALTAGLSREYPDAYREWHPVVTPALPALTGEARPRLILLFAAVVVVLLVAGVNLAALIGARGAARAREFTIRSVLGAGRWRQARVVAIESAWLGAAGTAAGLLLAAPAAATLRALAPEDIPRLENVALGWPVMAWAGAVMLVFVIVGTFAPLARLRRGAPGVARAATVAGAASRWGRTSLVVGQVAGAFVLLSAAGLLVRSFTRVLDVDPGFEPRNLALMRVFLTPPTYRSIESQKQYIERALDRLRQTPGVALAATVSQPPFDTEGAGSRLAVALEGRTYGPGEHPAVLYRTASEAYFRTVGMRLLEGRGLTDADRLDSPRVVVVNKALADRLWPGESPVGRRFAVAASGVATSSAASTPPDWYTVVGVVNDVATDGLETQERPALYAPYQQRTLTHLRWTTFVVRTTRDVEAELPSIRAAVQSLDPDQPIYAVGSMEAVISRSVAERRFSLTLMLVFAGLALLLAAIGLYGALAQGVAARMREIGVRLAVGADPGSVFRLIAGEGARVVLVGGIVGALVTWAGSARIEALLFGVPPTDPATHGVMALVLAVVGAVASVVPARRASRVDPVQALRAD